MRVKMKNRTLPDAGRKRGKEETRKIGDEGE